MLSRTERKDNSQYHYIKITEIIQTNLRKVNDGITISRKLKKYFSSSFCSNLVSLGNHQISGFENHCLVSYSYANRLLFNQFMLLNIKIMTRQKIC